MKGFLGAFGIVLILLMVMYAIAYGWIWQLMIFLIAMVLILEAIQYYCFGGKKEEDLVAVAEKYEAEKKARNDLIIQRTPIRERMEIMAIDYKYDRIPESVYQTCKLLRGYYSLEEWKQKEPQTFNKLTEEQIKEYEEKLYEIQLLG